MRFVGAVRWKGRKLNLAFDPVIVQHQEHGKVYQSEAYDNDNRWYTVLWKKVQWDKDPLDFDHCNWESYIVEEV